MGHIFTVTHKLVRNSDPSCLLIMGRLLIGRIQDSESWIRSTVTAAIQFAFSVDGVILLILKEVVCYFSVNEPRLLSYQVFEMRTRTVLSHPCR
jgi:hypothetical protein